jgi:hypothetical protein
METQHPLLVFVAGFVGLWLALFGGSWLHERKPNAEDEQHDAWRRLLMASRAVPASPTLT